MTTLVILLIILAVLVLAVIAIYNKLIQLRNTRQGFRGFRGPGVGPRQLFDIVNEPAINDAFFCLRTAFLNPKLSF